MKASAQRIEYLTAGDLLEIACAVAGEVVVRDRGLLDSAAARPQSTVLGGDAYPAFADKAAALMHSLARNHALVDANRRLAWAATRILCLLNGRDLTFEVDDAEALVLSVARGEADATQIAVAIAEHLSTQAQSLNGGGDVMRSAGHSTTVPSVTDSPRPGGGSACGRTGAHGRSS